MTNEPTIRYELLTSAGLRTVAGDHVAIPNDAGATFGIHTESHLPDGHPEKCVVTHLASGLRIGHGATRTAALASATSNVDRNRDRLRAMLDQAMTSRYELQHAVQRLQQNHHDILGGAAA
ncbi:bacteriophage protein [Burkholderia pseudomallei]|nr:bacteriophage protein [Burkholderia pseudomallei]